MTRTTLESAILSMAAALTRTSTRGVDPAMPFALMGLDSLATVELAAALEDTTGLTILPEVVSDAGNARALASRLQRMVHEPLREHRDPFELMLIDASYVLRATSGVRRASRAQRATRGGLRGARTILLTGATGFLGRWLARELLDTSEAKLVCLVRRTTESGRERLHRSLLRAGVAFHAIDQRVVAVEGDLAQPRLGLTSAGLDHVKRVDAICHAGAAVNWVDSYASLRQGNVLGTIELLELALRTHAHFHFVSSISTCYSTDGPRDVDEDHDPMPHLRGIHLGYAQTKAVAEALVRQASAHGLRTTIYRPAIIGGHSSSPDFNPDDLLALLIRGCVHMGAAPDLDWTLDVVPVDEVARRILDLSPGSGTFHLQHPQPRHWRDCVLWMRVYGYPLALLPFPAWLHQLERELDAARAHGARHPLAPLRRFFTERPQGCGGLTLPQLYEDVRRTRALSRRTKRRRQSQCRELDGTLLDHYFAAFRSAGELPPPAAPIGSRGTALLPSSAPALAEASFDHRFFSNIVGSTLGTISRARLVRRRSHHSIVSDLTSWQSNRPTGLFEYRLQTPAGVRDVMLKLKPRDSDVIAVGEALARVCDDGIGRAYHRWHERVGLARSHVREVEVYRQQDPRFVAHTPRLYGSISDERTGLWAVVLERVHGATHQNAVADVRAWDRQAIDASIDGLAALQSIWYGRERDLRSMSWIGFERTAGAMEEMRDFWSALAAHARARFSAWADPSMSAVHSRLVDGIGQWWRTLERGPRTLVHNDFNPRNICLRRTASGPLVCAYDWELATIGAPQRDLAEFLCFALPSDTDLPTIEAAIELHRTRLQRHAQCQIDSEHWRDGFRCSLYDVLVDRLALYALIHRIRPQAFLPRVVRTWRRLYEFFPLSERA